MGYRQNVTNNNRYTSPSSIDHSKRASCFKAVSPAEEIAEFHPVFHACVIGHPPEKDDLTCNLNFADTHSSRSTGQCHKLAVRQTMCCNLFKILRHVLNVTQEKKTASFSLGGCLFSVSIYSDKDEQVKGTDCHASPIAINGAEF